MDAERGVVLIANWKMHHGPDAARQFVDRFTSRYSPGPGRLVVLCPPAVSIEAVARAVSTESGIVVGVQNIWTEERGAFTGEISAPMAREAGATLALVGHSERRHVFGETNDQTARKASVAAAHGLAPVLCVGETLAQREAGSTAAAVLRQLHEGVAELSEEAAGKLLIAYEPVWAIGTGLTATPADASEVHGTIREALVRRWKDLGNRIPILYGGSVNASNAGSLLAAEGVSGLLVGGASLEAETWAAICMT